MGDAPDWVHLLPFGTIKAQDGRTFVNDEPRLIVDASNPGGVDLPVDYEHQNVRPDTNGSGPVPAAGWIKALAMCSDGISERADWT